MNGIPLDMTSDLGMSLRGHTLGELQDLALSLLLLDVENSGPEAAERLDKTHHAQSIEVCDKATEAANNHGQAIFLMLATGIDLICTSIMALDKLAFMSEIEEIGGDDG